MRTEPAGGRGASRAERTGRPRWWWLLLYLPLAAQAAVSVTDSSGNVVTLPHPAQRIVSLAPHLTELLFAVGAGGRIVGTVSYSDYPPAAKRIPNVGGYSELDLERIVALRPDLIVAWPSAEISVMGAEGAVEIGFRKQVAEADDPAAKKAELIEAYRKITDVYIAARNDMIDDVIDPEKQESTT